jgi:hypothetical protein
MKEEIPFRGLLHLGHDIDRDHLSFWVDQLRDRSPEKGPSALEGPRFPATRRLPSSIIFGFVELPRRRSIRSLCRFQRKHPVVETVDDIHLTAECVSVKGFSAGPIEKNEENQR